MNEPYTYANHESPGLKPIKPDLGPRPQTPPPFGQDPSPGRVDDKYGDKDPLRAKNSRILKVGQREATAALLRGTIAPYNHEILRPNKALEEPFEPESTTHDLANKAGEALGLINTAVTEPPRPAVGDKPQPPSSKGNVDGPGESRLSPSSHTETERSPPSLSKFLITDPGNQNSLPALRDPATSGPPDDAGTILPPIKTQLGQLRPVLPPPTGGPPRTAATSSFSLPPVTALSPPMARAEPTPWEPHPLTRLAPPKIPASPYSHLSPASSQTISSVSSPVSQPTYWRGAPKPSGPYPYDPPSTASRSPATSYPTPIEHTPAGASEPASFVSSQVNGPPAPTGTFKCHHPGCNAAPFQTQYLLNSHANVHSQDRPHFCPIEGCSRGPGGKGFKRKNEMIRHGLVHNSPGYVCPFCPDQQHKYPRPDNLQRHVRVHHVDKSKDDAALRHVLSQRPEGSGRGRRRRINAQ
ncbi:uncharacterized protein BJX67DRAFT_362493 [Aspergillus lucknowensis]|uniref:C2H2-type domain-containing protein n=1 Tax=Aspergillus lucknowensis TaxID=176173 RepID=A0ABR4LII6_9EURO